MSVISTKSSTRLSGSGEFWTKVFLQAIFFDEPSLDLLSSGLFSRLVDVVDRKVLRSMEADDTGRGQWITEKCLDRGAGGLG
jgi:hypothetical protein